MRDKNLEKARLLRQNHTTPERLLWSKLRHQQLDHKFRRQVPFPPFIVDFYCAELKLVIEIDGETHTDTIKYDKKRTASLERLGLTIIRFTNYDVMKNLEGVLEKILKTSPPHPDPLPQGERE